MTVRVGWKPWLGVLGIVLLALAPTRRALEADMATHMLVQLPLLALCGWWLAQALPRGVSRALTSWNRSGITGLLLASITGLFWMLPLALDRAIESPGFELAKFVSIPLLIGAALALSWPRAGFVVRAVVLAETIATAFRIGWLYLAAETALCANYLLGEQQVVGKLLLAAGGVVLLGLLWKLVWGHVHVPGR